MSRSDLSDRERMELLEAQMDNALDQVKLLSASLGALIGAVEANGKLIALLESRMGETS